MGKIVPEAGRIFYLIFPENFCFSAGNSSPVEKSGNLDLRFTLIDPIELHKANYFNQLK